MQKKLLGVFGLVLLALLGLLIRLSWINVKSGRQYAKKVLSQQSYDSQTIPYRRGEIEDRNGIVLAKSDRVYNVVLDCKAINSDEDYIEPTIEAVSEVFNLKEADIRQIIEDDKTKDSQYQVILKKISEDQKKKYEDYVSTDEERKLTAEETKKLRNVQGVWFEEHYDRSYPYSTLASNVIGFSNDIDQGVCGIEEYYDSLLNGTNGRSYGYLNSDTEFVKRTIEPTHGHTLVSTIDMNIQQIVEEKIQEFDETYGDEEHHDRGAENIGVVVMDPNTGEILAMASNREFDLNDPNDLTNEYTGAEIKAMSNEEYVNALNEKWRNFCVSTSYEPGSVVKPLTVATALELGVVHDGDHFYCDGGEFITDTYIKCDNVYGHGDETLEYAIVNSCNDALMQIGFKITIPNFIKYQKLFNLGSQTGIDLPGETPGVIYSYDNMHEVELGTCSFGQGYTINMVQEAAAISSVINGGYYYQPHVIKQVKNADGSVEKTVEPLVLKQPVSSSTSALIRQYMTTAVQEGTGRKSQVPGYLTGGKTGTAEKIDPETGKRAGGKYLVSFIGAAPMDNPQVLIYCIVDEPNVAEQADSSYPQKLFQSIATEVFPYLGLYPTEEVTPELLSFLELTAADIVQSGDKITTAFQVYDAAGTLRSDAYVNQAENIVDSSGTLIEGCTLNEDGTVTDAWGNVITPEYTNKKEEEIDPVADNPDIASPPEEVDDASGTDTTWSGITSDDLKDDEADDAG